ncbi:MAG TPA: hypothetical protein VJ732_08580 [Bryobacteraceae bacterium]|nr:hypothetical protein [Bryobacteraceae bacterium]
MQIDLESLRRHYRSLSDGELSALKREELIEGARKCLEEEWDRRGLDASEEPEAPVDEEGYDRPSFAAPADADWLEDAACACSFASQPGGSSASDAEDACRALQDAGIPCQLSTVEVAPATGDQPAQHEFRVMVPGALNLEATSILDQEVFNPQLEADWRAHLESLTDDELAALHPDVICAGLLDRIARLKSAYNDEVSRRFRHSSG